MAKQKKPMPWFPPLNSTLWPLTVGWLLFNHYVYYSYESWHGWLISGAIGLIAFFLDKDWLGFGWEEVQDGPPNPRDKKEE